MSENDKDVVVPFSGKVQEQAILLLAEAESHDGGAAVVRTQTGAFLVPESVAKAAGQKYEDTDEVSDEARTVQPGDDDSYADGGGDRALTDPVAVNEESKALAEEQAERETVPVLAGESEPPEKSAAKKATAKKSAAKGKE